MPASRRVSQRQLEILLAFVEANKDIALGRCTRGPLASQTTQQAWETVANKLNSVADGVTKPAALWRRYWIEWKAKTKTKAADIRRNASKTGGGPNKLVPLTDLEERILQLIGRVCVEGLPGVRMPFPIPSDNTSLPPSQPSTSQATDSISEATPSTSHIPSTSEMEVEWLEDEILQSEILSSQLPLPQSSSIPETPQANSPLPPIPTPSPPPQSSPTRPASSQQPQSSPPLYVPTPSPPAQPAQSPRLRSRQRLIRNRDVPQWARRLEERRLDVEEMHARALESLSATLERRLANIEDRLREICNKLGNK